ncbi:esterase E4-like [Battus philenor]|uniref:esterase E4-like n=1 Tax=Battus philenor TaxID=42288 RepID=UPI0035D0DE7E
MSPHKVMRFPSQKFKHTDKINIHKAQPVPRICCARTAPHALFGEFFSAGHPPLRATHAPRAAPGRLIIWSRHKLRPATSSAVMDDTVCPRSALVLQTFSPRQRHPCSLGAGRTLPKGSVPGRHICGLSLVGAVEVSSGLLEGEVVENPAGGKFYSFKGIPYAAPPLGELRFKVTHLRRSAFQPWPGIRSAKDFGPVCHQFDMLTLRIVEGREDCLYLNVYSPKLAPSSALPVMVWIHGGGFFSGNDLMYGPDFLVRHGIVLVTLNYRLELLGFLSLESEEVPGNAGMKDQMAALRWVQLNIRKFGGDPDKVTIFGESAGAACVSFHLVSPMSKGLFRRAIAQSGSSHCWWAQATRPRKRARLLARQMGLDSDDNNELYEFFKVQPIKDMIFKMSPLTWSEQCVDRVKLFFSVVDEKKFGDSERFFYREIADRVHDDVEVITVYMKDDGLLAMGIKCDVEKTLQQINLIPEYLVPKALSWTWPMSKQIETAEKMHKYYYNNKLVTEETLEPLIRFLSKDAFVYGTMTWLRTVAAAGRNKLYLYRFSGTSERNVMTRVFGLQTVAGPQPRACHADDLAYLFPLKQFLGAVEPGAKSYEMIHNLTKLWTDLAKFGDPMPDASSSRKWRPYTLEHEEYLEIGETLVPGAAPVGADMQFWDSVFESIGLLML